MKRFVVWAMVAAFLMIGMTAYAESKECWYLEENGEHDYEQTNAVYATCKEAGYYELECRQCGHYKKVKTEKAHGHEWTEIHREEPGDSYYGIVIEECNNCNETRSEKLYVKGTLYRGIKEPAAVKDMQKKLIDCGYLNDSADGVFGKNTEAAVKAFQKAAKLNVDGIAFPQTLNKLEKEWKKQQKKATPKPTATPEPTAEPVVEKYYSPFCYTWEDVNGMMVTEQCEKHALLWEATQSMLADNYADSALHSYYEWQGEIISMYNIWEDLVDETAKGVVAANKAQCIAMMDAQKQAMWSSYEANGIEIDPGDMYYGAELWMRTHAMWLCQMLSTLGAE